MSEQLIQQLINGLLIGCVYALIAIGLTLIWGVMNIVNFAHGDFLMLSMYISFWSYTLWGIDPVLAIPVCAALLFALGLLVYKFAVSKVMNGPMLAQVVVTFGVSIFIDSALSPATHSYPEFTVTLYPFTCRLTGGAVTLHEHHALKWLEPHQMPELDWAAADLPVIREYMAVIAENATL